MSESGVTTYFAYGSNMSEKVMSEVAPSAECTGTGMVADHRLAFTRRSRRWKAGAADISKSPGLSIYGVLYTIDDKDLLGLDRKEGAPDAYERICVDVQTSRGLISAMTYAVVKPEPEEIKPHPDYFQHILNGARENQMPELFLQFLSYVEEQFATGTRNEGLLLAPTEDRKASAGKPLIRVNPRDSGTIRRGQFGAVAWNGKRSLGKVELTDEVPAGTGQADQTIRESVGIYGQFFFGQRVAVMPCTGRLPHRSIIQPRALTLPACAISRNDIEKNYCVLHPDRIKVLGLQEGEFARLFAAPPSAEEIGASATVQALTIRVFSGSAATIIRNNEEMNYPDRSELYLDKDTRRLLGLPQQGWERSPVLVRPA